MSNYKRVVQPPSDLGSRDESRDHVTPLPYTQLSMTNLLASVTTSCDGSELNAPRVRFAMPSAGRPFTTEASRWNETVLDVEAVLVAALTVVEMTGPMAERGPVHASGQLQPVVTLVSRRLIACWLVGVLAEQLTTVASLSEAELWFSGSVQVSRAIPADVEAAAVSALAGLVSRSGAQEMLPYALDPVRHEYRRDLLNGESAGEARAERKERGSFFTPVDVVEHIVGLALGSLDVGGRTLRTLDPAVGTGVFLRSVFAGLLKNSVSKDEALKGLHGIDLMESCVEMTAFVLLADWLDVDRGSLSGPAIGPWSQIRSRLLAADTLNVLDGASETRSLFGRDDRPVWVAGGFDVIVGNPPYARIGDRKDLCDLQETFETLAHSSTATDVYVAFVELLCSQLRPEGSGAFVVPMSLGFGNTQALRCLRSVADRVGGHWRFEFFDRTPDALFGDDVKQRAAIVCRTATEGRRITTAPVLRWTSRNRSSLFDRIPVVELGDFSIAAGVPKLGNTVEAEAYLALRRRQGRFEEGVVSSRRVVPPVFEEGSSAVFVAGTAYNWLTVFRDGPSITRDLDNPSTSGVLELQFNDSLTADAAYAVLCSRLVYWLWRVEGDAFHVPSGWLGRLPFTVSAFSVETISQLGELGRLLWGAVAVQPVVSLNGGRTTISYCPHACPELLDKIDLELASLLGLSSEFLNELAGFARKLAVAGRSSTGEHGLRRALASWNED